MQSGTLSLVAGEASGDYLGANLIGLLRERFTGLSASGIGGDAMAAQGMQIWFPSERLAVMGLFEPIRRLPELLRIRRQLRRRLLASPPDVFVGIDAPDFNLPLEKRLRARGVPVVHYVSPSVWAWRKGRIRTIAAAVDSMLCLLPFEMDIYRRAGIRARCVGHPLAWRIPLEKDAAGIRKLKERMRIGEGAALVALLPGSRAGEVAANLPGMLRSLGMVLERHPDAHFAIAPASAARRRQMEPMLKGLDETVSGRIRLAGCSAGELLAAADAALVVMGTATLEAMLHRTPMVTTYRTGALNYRLLRSMAYIEHFSLPNLLSGEPLVPEILQDEATPEALAAALCELLEKDQGPVLKRFAELHLAVRGEGADAAAEEVAGLAGWGS